MQRDDMTKPLIELKKLRREFLSGGEPVAVLKDVDLTIHAGEIVAIVGASGSGKSTLMNIIGCLDQATSGDYFLNGQEVKNLDADELAAFRRERFGFIFQRYHLLSDLTAQGNVEVPAIYAGYPTELRHERSKELLTRLGLNERIDHKPSQLSGGQQQRVSIARALMNGGSVILADEPTGALDSHSGVEVMKILSELHEAGHTIIIVTHDMNIAEYADRVIEIKDGEIIGDTRKKERQVDVDPKELLVKGQKHPFLALWGRLSEAFKMALLAMKSHKLRTFLTMLGIIIGIASVVSVVALGEGSKQNILSNISSIGTNTITIFPSRGFGDTRSGRIETLVADDAKVLRAQSYVDSVTPTASTSRVVRYGNVEATGSIQGVSFEYFRVQDVEIAEGIEFDEAAENELAQVAVIDHNTREKLFADYEDPIGQVIFLGSMPVRIIGVAVKKESAFGSSDTLNIFLPYTTVLKRMLGQNHLNNITVRVSDNAPMQAAEQGIAQLLTMRHGTKDFTIRNVDTIRTSIESTMSTMTLLISSIAVISLVVGGIGVMNIMLVSVTERTREIGVRMAVGARRSDIQQQFLIEAVLVCILGGMLGILLALVIGMVFDSFSTDFKLIYSVTSMVVAFICSTLIGIVFGYLPANNAAKLNPVDALSSD